MEINAPAFATTSSWFIEGVVELSSAAGLATGAGAATLVLLAIVPGLGMPDFFVAAGATAVPLAAALGGAAVGSSAAAAAFGAAFLGVPLAPALNKKLRIYISLQKI